MIRGGAPRAVLAGVCADWAERLGVDVTVVRAVVLVLTLMKGLGVVLYALGFAWRLLGDRDRRARWGGRVGEAMRVLVDDASRSFHDLASGRSGERRARTLGVALTAGGGLVLLWASGFQAWLSPGRALALGALAGGVALLFGARGRRTA